MRSLRLASLVLAAAGASACLTDSASLLIEDAHNVEFEGGGCAAGSVSLSGSTLDTRFGGEFALGLSIRNLMLSTANPGANRGDAHGVTIDRVRSTVVLPDGTTLPTQQQPLFAFVQSNGLARVVARLVVGEAAEQLLDAAGAFPPEGATVIVRAEVHGVTGEGMRVDSNIIEFPVKVCTNCTLLACEEPPAVPGSEPTLKSGALIANCGGGLSSLSCIDAG